ncbi:MAG: cobalamin-binding protein [Xanthomonadales bacterium]|jgi:iron complex transport system substrate-binding protein|nr:cobalamin-binding protein [Xanthomonadales bacterium]
MTPSGRRHGGPAALPALLALALPLLCASGAASTPDPTPARSTIELTQHGGGTLRLEQPARRIVTLAPHLAELVFLAGAGERLVATVAYSDTPAEASELPRIGDAFRFDLERLVALEPDLVLAWDSGNPDAALAAMDRLGLPVWRTEIRDIPAMARLIEDLASATRLPTSPEADAVRARWAALGERYAGQRPLRYFYQVAERPLYTINGEHLVSQALAACGGVNVFADLPTLAPQIGAEAVIAADPEILLAGRFDPDSDPLAGWRDWPGLGAVQRDAFILLPADRINRATPRMLDALEAACARMDEHRSRYGAAP